MKCFTININLEPIKNKLYISHYEIGQPIIIFNQPSQTEWKLSFKTIDVIPSDLKDKSIYRYPKLTLPRNKIDILKEKYNLSVTRSKDEADYKIISKEYIESLLERKWNDVVFLSDFIEYVNNTSSNWEDSTLKVIDEIKNQLQVNEKCGLTLINKIGWGQRSNVVYDIYENIPSIEYRGIFEIKDENEIKEILGSDNLVIDNVLCSMTTEDSVILTETDYINISKMINSKSSDNINLALELLANSNIEKSIDVIGLLFYLNYHTLKDVSTNWQSINVKTLRKRFSEFIPYGQTNVYYYDRLIKSLIKEKALTVFAFKRISIEMLDHLTRSVGFNEESVFDLKVEDIKLKSEYQKCLVLNDNGQEVIESISSFQKNPLPF